MKQKHKAERGMKLLWGFVTVLIGRTVLGEGGDINVGAKRRKCVCVSV